MIRVAPSLIVQLFEPIYAKAPSLRSFVKKKYPEKRLFLRKNYINFFENFASSEHCKLLAHELAILVYSLYLQTVYSLRIMTVKVPSDWSNLVGWLNSANAVSLWGLVSATMSSFL